MPNSGSIFQSFSVNAKALTRFVAMLLAAFCAASAQGQTGNWWDQVECGSELPEARAGSPEKICFTGWGAWVSNTNQSSFRKSLGELQGHRNALSWAVAYLADPQSEFTRDTLANGSEVFELYPGRVHCERDDGSRYTFKRSDRHIFSRVRGGEFGCYWHQVQLDIEPLVFDNVYCIFGGARHSRECFVQWVVDPGTEAERLVGFKLFLPKDDSRLEKLYAGDLIRITGKIESVSETAHVSDEPMKISQIVSFEKIATMQAQMLVCQSTCRQEVPISRPTLTDTPVRDLVGKFHPRYFADDVAFGLMSYDLDKYVSVMKKKWEAME